MFRKNIRLSVGACLALLVSVTACERPRSTVEIVTGPWPPYTEEEAEGQGALTEALSAALTSMGYRPRYRFVPFYRAKDHARQRRVAGTFPWFVTEEVQRNWIVVEQPLFEVEYVFFSRRDSLQREGIDPATAASLEDLEGLAFGGVEGYTYSNEVRRRIGEKMYPSETLAFRALFESGEKAPVDVLPASREVGLDLVTGPFATEEVEIAVLDQGDLSFRQPVYFLVNPGYPGAETFARELEGELERLEASGFHGGLGEPDLASRRVRLTGPSGAAGVPAYRDRDDPQPAFRIPHGSPAVVVQWADSFEGRAPDAPGDDPAHRCRVRLLKDPGRGRLVWVSGTHVHREGEAP